MSISVKFCTNCNKIIDTTTVEYRFCPSCKSELIEREVSSTPQLFAKRQGEKASSLIKGLTLSLVAAFIGGLAWGLIAYLLQYIFVIGAIIIGIFIAFAMYSGTKEITSTVQLAVVILTIGSVLFGDFIYIVLILVIDLGLPFGFDLISVILQNFIETEIESGGILSFIFAIIGAIYAIVQLGKIEDRDAELNFNRAMQNK